MIKKYALNKITVTTMYIILLGLFYMIPTNNKINYQTETNTEKNTIYLLDEDKYLSQVTYYFTKQSIEEEIKSKINILINGNPVLNNFYPTIPQNTKINSIKVDKNSVYIDFNEIFLTISKEKEERMIESIIYSLSEINGIENIYITINNKELKELPNSKKELSYPLNRSYGINKEYNLNDLKNINKTTIVFSKTKDDLNYYVPLTLINNNDDEKINIIIEELKSAVHSQNKLNGHINDNLKLEEYKINSNTMTLVFNEYIYQNEETKMISDEVKYVISESIFENYDVNELIINTKNEKNVIKIAENP